MGLAVTKVWPRAGLNENTQAEQFDFWIRGACHAEKIIKCV